MRHQRRLIFRPANRIHVFDPLSGDPLGFVADISATGLRLLTQEPIEAGRLLRVSLEMPVIAGRTRPLELDVVCRWSRRNATTRRYEQGLKLQQPSAEFANLVESLAETRAAARGEPV